MFMHDVYVAQLGNTTYAVRSNGRVIAKTPVGSDCARVLKAAIDAVPVGGSLGIKRGTYVVTAPYALPLDPDGSNMFFTGFPIVNKFINVYGSTTGETIIKLAPGQRSASRHVALMLVRSKGPFAPGYDNFTISDITFDCNRSSQGAGIPHDGEGAILVGSSRTNGNYLRLKFINSHGCGLYLGNNGSGVGVNEKVDSCYARNCAGAGIMLDTCKDSSVMNCSAYNCREGLYLWGNDDYKTRALDNVSVDRFVTDSQVIVGQVNDFVLNNIDMNCSRANNAYGLAIRDATGRVVRSRLINDKNKSNSLGGATYIYGGSQVMFNDCDFEGHFGLHAINWSVVVAENCRLSAPGACYCTTDPDPVSSKIVAKNCAWSGNKIALQSGSSFEES